nr:hypothetical protein [Tanacetum cinerariifolium]
LSRKGVTLKCSVSQADVEDSSRAVVFFVYFGAGIWYVEICLCTVSSSLEHIELSQDAECCFFLKFVSSGYFRLRSSIFADKSDKEFLFRLIKRDCKEISNIFSQGNIVTNSRETPSWREIVSLTVLVKLASFT